MAKAGTIREYVGGVSFVSNPHNTGRRTVMESVLRKPRNLILGLQVPNSNAIPTLVIIETKIIGRRSGVHAPALARKSRDGDTDRE
jgi:hypothetical protein